MFWKKARPGSAFAEESLVVTSDREIAVFATRRGKTAIAAASFDPLLARSAAGPSAADTPAAGGNPDDDDERTGGKKKDPSRRISKQKRAALARFKKL